MPPELVGREGEFRAIHGFLERIEDGPAALILSGESGIGKTALWEAGVEGARQRFGRVLAHRSVAAEASFAFIGLSDLLADVLEDVAPSLAQPRRRALEVALLLVESNGNPPEPAAIGMALLDTLRLLAAARPIVVALDDLQWLDAASAAVLPVALRRLRRERVGLLATMRDRPGARSAFELDRCFAEDRSQRVQVGPLDLPAVRRLLRSRLAAEPTRAELARVHETSGGNPFFALELGSELTSANARPAGAALPVPESLRALLGERLDRLPTETVDLLVGAAALARPTVELVAAACTSATGVSEALDFAVRERVVELEGSRVRFSHPLLASISYERAPLGKRRAVHRALADAVADPEERARHLALASEGPNGAGAAELDAAATQAAGRGAPAAAAELCELAAQLTPGDAPAARLRLRRAANYHRLGGAGQQAEGLLRQLLGEVPSGLERAAVLFALASTRQDDTRGMIRLCNEALEEAPEGDALVARILALRSWSRFLEGDLLASLADARSALEKAEQAGDEAMIAVAIARVGHAEAYVGEITRGLLERGAAIESRLGLSLESTESPRAMLARTWVRLGQVEAPRAAFVELEALAAARGDEASRAEMLWGLSMVEWAAGRLLVGLEHATETVETAEQIQDTHVRAAAARVKALIEADLGLVERSRASAEGSLALAQTMSDKSIAAFVQGVLGRLELELGNVEAAARYLRELPLRQLAVGFTDPTVPVWSDSIEALIAVGELDQARAYLEHYELQAERLGSPWAAAGAMRCRGLLASAEGDLAAAFTAFERSLSELDRISRPLDRGRALLGLGSTHRQARQKRAARDALELAVEIFEGLGARLWADRALAELRRISGRRRASEALTETEERVAWLAADGRSNKEIAAELYMSLHTVGAHLSRTYRKLEIRSRSELTARMRGVAAQHANEGHPSTKPAKEAPKT